jgi:hypothetical protein
MSSGALYNKVTTTRVYDRSGTVMERDLEVAQSEDAFARNEDGIGFDMAMDNSTLSANNKG